MSESPESRSSSSAESTPELLASRAMSAAARAAAALREAAMELPEFAVGAAAGPTAPPRDPLALLGDVDLDVTIELGRTLMYVEDVLRLDTDSVIELDKTAGDPVDILINNRPVARGDVVVIDDRFCIRITEVLPAPSAEE